MKYYFYCKIVIVNCKKKRKKKEIYCKMFTRILIHACTGQTGKTNKLDFTEPGFHNSVDCSNLTVGFCVYRVSTSRICTNRHKHCNYPQLSKKKKLTRNWCRRFFWIQFYLLRNCNRKYMWISTGWHNCFNQIPAVRSVNSSYTVRRLLCPLSLSLWLHEWALVLREIFLAAFWPLLKQDRDLCSSSRASGHRKM